MADMAQITSPQSDTSTASSHTLIGDPDDSHPSDAQGAGDMNSHPDQSVVSPEERILELNKVDQDIVEMMKHMGLAVQAMTAKEGVDLTLEKRRDIFDSSIVQAFTLLAAIDVAQRRSIYALAEAGIIEDGASKSATSKSEASLIGNLDVSVLNSQNDKVGKEIESEQWAKVREMLETLQKTGVQ